MTPVTWSEFLYLGIGLTLGISSHSLWKRKSSKPVEFTPALSESHANSTSENHEEQLQSLSEQLKQTQLAYQMAMEMGKFKAGFLARTSHELRSPLNSMIGTLQLITADLCDGPEEEREFIEQAHTSALKMVGLIDEIISVAKTEHGTEKMSIEPLQLAKIFDQVEDLTYLQAANRSIRLKIVPPESSIYVLADQRRLRQVLVGLVDNAIAAMDEGSICVSSQLAADGQFVQIWIDDQRPVSAWSESWDLLQQDLEKGPALSSLVLERSAGTEQLSPGMRLLMNQTLLTLMQGRLEVLAVPSEGEESNFTRTQCLIPVAPAP